jgi:hypothetical protein
MITKTNCMASDVDYIKVCLYSKNFYVVRVCQEVQRK